MDDLNSIYWKRNGSNISIGIDVKSIEEGSRIVTGFATLNNIDFAGDIVDPDASVRAFKEFRGNVRFQHDKYRPVGKVLAFEPVTIFNEETGETAEAIKVAVKVVEDAAWELVKEDVLNGFSIGAAVRKAERVYNDALKKTVQVIKDYKLLELSLVDSPMNELANVLTVHKSLDTLGVDEEKGFVGSNLFWCASDRIASKKSADRAECPKCSESMANLGHIHENTDIQTQLNKVFEISEKGGHPQVADSTINKDAEGEDIDVAPDAQGEASEEAVVEDTETVAEDVVETPEEVTETEEVAPVAEVDTEIDEVSNTVEAEVQENTGLTDEKLEEFMTQLRTLIKEEVTVARKSYEDLSADFSSRFEKVEKSFEALETTFSELKGAQEELTEKINSVTSEYDAVQKRLDVVAGETAVKQSMDSEITRETTTKSGDSVLWDGLFTKNISGFDA